MCVLGRVTSSNIGIVSATNSPSSHSSSLPNRYISLRSSPLYYICLHWQKHDWILILYSLVPSCLSCPSLSSLSGLGWLGLNWFELNWTSLLSSGERGLCTAPLSYVARLLKGKIKSGKWGKDKDNRRTRRVGWLVVMFFIFFFPLFEDFKAFAHKYSSSSSKWNGIIRDSEEAWAWAPYFLFYSIMENITFHLICVVSSGSGIWRKVWM